MADFGILQPHRGDIPFTAHAKKFVKLVKFVEKKDLGLHLIRFKFDKKRDS